MSTIVNCIQWMVNQEDQSPCVTAQEVGQLCNQGYSVSLSDFQEYDYVPNATTANGCTCSWSIYNLLSACSYCIGQRQYTSWDTWISNCGNYALNTSYLPFGLSVSQGIPFWAATNPSTWVNATFNVIQAADIAEEAKPDVTGGALPTSTASTSSSSVSIGMITGLVIGVIVIIAIGALFILWAVHRRRRRRTYTEPTEVPSFNTSHTVIAPSIQNHPAVQPTSCGDSRASLTPIFPYLTSPVRSTMNQVPTSHISPVPTGFVSNRRSALPVTDGADIISPFNVLPSNHQTNRANTSAPTSKSAEALSARVSALPAQRVRLNPPPYSASIEPGSNIFWERRLSTRTQKKRESSVSGATAYSGHSRTESPTTAHAVTRTKQNRRRATSPGMAPTQSVKSGMSFSIDSDSDTVMQSAECVDQGHLRSDIALQAPRMSPDSA